MQVKKLVSDIIKISDDLEKKDTQLLYQEKIIDGLRSEVRGLKKHIDELNKEHDNDSQIRYNKKLNRG